MCDLLCVPVQVNLPPEVMVALDASRVVFLTEPDHWIEEGFSDRQGGVRIFYAGVKILRRRYQI